MPAEKTDKEKADAIINNDKKQDIVDKIKKWKSESDNLMSRYYNRWAKNLDLTKGRFPENEREKSKVRKRSKLFFRKIWAAKWRFKAAMYSMFMQDPNKFRVVGRGGEDVLRSGVLQKAVEYRRDLMMREDSLFLQFDWAMDDIFDLGCCFGKLYWCYNKDVGIDKPEFILYPPEQVKVDLSAETFKRRRYVIFINYLTKDEMEELGYENLSKLQTSSLPDNIVRSKRFQGGNDPLQNPASDREYPVAGAYNDDQKAEAFDGKYETWECFYKEKGKVKYCVLQNDLFLVSPMDSPYGDRIPLIEGFCLTEAHKTLGEGFPESAEAPQESLNATLNMRKDNLALLLNKHKLVNKFADVDIPSLVNLRTGGITLHNGTPDAVKEMDMRDVTQSAYIESNADETMIEELTGITDVKNGMERSDKATVAQINYQEANAKIDYFGAIVGETFFKNFFTQLTWLVSKFETDETVIRVANESFRKSVNDPYSPEVYDFDFKFDCIIDIGAGLIGKQQTINQTLLAMDRATMANQAMFQMMQTGAIPPNKMRIVDTTKFIEDLLPELGKKNVNDYFIQLNAPQQPTGGAPEQAMAGLMQPQVGELRIPNEANALQAGAMGGV